MRLGQPAMLYIFPAGFALLYWAEPSAYSGLTLAPPAFGVVWPEPNDWWAGLTRGALPQLPLTLLNSVVAVCALSADYFPGRGIPPRRMAASVGLMNLVCVPLGGMPMCHGAGGLAAQHRFGARTGGSVILLGVMKIAAGLVLGAGLLSLLQAYPRSILAVMVLAAGLTLAAAARDALKGRALVLVILTGGPILLVNTLAGFLVGCGAAGALALVDRFRRSHADPGEGATGSHE
jgi:MFS superfamily sulfate permease-like transporter